ncbi:hypothetical protein LVO79_10055 [Roseivivax marinus]|jgi:hypothetical protein|nr:hypothetical protein [Roseivivax marinus]UMA63404.1 hypothetical protein LVO79_10055 [Roseivivax marinus]SEL58327.1 hypothetical protein SAMN05444413_11165 [Roseivivax marinus]
MERAERINLTDVPAREARSYPRAAWLVPAALLSVAAWVAIIAAVVRTLA